jgi:hypothetical protein
MTMPSSFLRRAALSAGCSRMYLSAALGLM